MSNVSIPILGYQVYALPVNTIVLEQSLPTIINTLNPHSYCTAKKDRIFYEALQQSHILLPDGEGVVLTAKILQNKKIKKIAGSDLHLHLLSQLNQKSGKVFYLGASEQTLIKIGERLRNEYPNILYAYYSPPYKDEFSESDSFLMAEAANTFCPDVLFVGMTAPKQEKWVYLNKHRLNARIICSVGAVFGFYARTAKRPPQIFIALKLEWLGRLLREPKRMWRRNFVSAPIFLWDVLIEKLKLLHNK